MGLLDDLTTARAGFDAATATLRAAQAAYDSAQPHLTLWDEVVAEAEKLGSDVAMPFREIALRAKTLLGVL